LNFPVGLCERCGLHSANGYNAEQINGLMSKEKVQKLTIFIAEYLASSQISSCCVWGKK
jgi:hypothetical protein